MIRLSNACVSALAIASALAIGGCGDDGGPAGPCLLVRLDSVMTAQPSKVSAFFTVDRCDDNSPVVGLTSSQVEIREDGQRLTAAQTQQRLVRSPDLFRVHTILVLGVTHSAVVNGELPAIQAAAREIVQSLLAQGPEHHIAIYTFDGADMMQRAQDFTNDGQALEVAITRLAQMQCDDSADCVMANPLHATCALGSETGICVDESVNLYGAVVDGITTLDASLSALSSVPFKIGNFVIVTESADQASSDSRANAVSRANGTQSSVFAISLGDQADREFLDVIGQDGRAHAPTAAEITQAAGLVADTIERRTGRNYLLEYCSPKRAGNHTLSITVTAGEDSAVGEASRSFSAAGFMSGCSL